MKREGNNVFKGINSFHKACVAIWETGESEKYWDTWFSLCDEPYNEDWAKMHMEMMDEDYMAYVAREEPIQAQSIGVW